RIARRAGGADDAQRRPDECAFEDLGVDERLRVDVFEIPNPATRLHLGVARHGDIRPLLAGRLRVARGGVAHGQRDVARGHVVAGADAEAGLALGPDIAGGLALIGVHALVLVIAPGVALAGVERHAIAGRDFSEPLALDHAAHVVRGDDTRI